MMRDGVAPMRRLLSEGPCRPTQDDDTPEVRACHAAMVVRLPLMRPFDVITFDCYGTLIDWEAGITEAFRDAAAADGVRLDPAAVLSALFDTRPAAEAPVYRSYREILTDAAARDRIGARRWLHAAQSYFHDVTPGVAHGIPVAWINRKGERPAGAGRPDREFRTLTELADWLA